MSTLHVFSLKISGEGRDAVKERLENSKVPTAYGCVLDLRNHGGVIRCDTEHGDDITVEQDAIHIKGESDGDLPFDVVQHLSQEFSEITFELSGTDLTNLRSQRWTFESGEGRLLDCVEDADQDDTEIVYMLNGEQFLPLPEWIAVDDRKLPNPRADMTDKEEEIIRQKVGHCGERIPQYVERDALILPPATAAVEQSGDSIGPISDEAFLKELEDLGGSTDEDATRPDAAHVHTWVAFSTAVADGWIMLQCCDCGLHGVIKDPSSEEWSDAFHSPSRPYPWHDEARVVPQPQVPSTLRYVMRSENVPRCECYSKRGIIEPANFERCPNEITRPALRLTNDDRKDFHDMAEIARSGRLCSFLFEFFRFIRLFGGWD